VKEDRYVIPVRFRVLALAAAAVLAAGACTGSSASPTPKPTPTIAPTTSAVPTPTPTPKPTPVATVPEDQLVVPGHLTICSDIPYPPQEFWDPNGDPTGSDIAIGNEIASRLGLKPTVQNTVFDVIILALSGGKCDIIISAQNITTDRLKQVDMIPYFQAGQAFLVQKDNPENIKTATDLCGRAVAAESGTTEVDALNGTGDYKGQGLSAACTKAGNKAITVKTFKKDSDALLALQTGQVDCYFTDAPVAGYYVTQHSDLVSLAPFTINFIREGISVGKDKTALKAAVTTALQSMMDDGTYLNILKKWGLESGAVTSATP
jgi:polar amino acid transport system substrate-binding protein